MDSMSRSGKRFEIPAAAAVIALGFYVLSALPAHPPAREALIRDAVARELLAGTSQGRQALVGSIWRAPLPTLLRVPFVYAASRALPPDATGRLFAVSGAAAVLALLYLFCRAGLPRVPSAGLAAAPALTPGFGAAMLDGSSALWTVLTALAVFIGFRAWRREHGLRGLAIFGLSAGLAAVSGMEILAWTGIVFGMLVFHEVFRRAPAAGKRAALLLLALPALYAFALWVLMNWLIMGDPLFFLRAAGAAPFRAAAIPAALRAGVAGWILLTVFAAAGAVLSREREAPALAAAALAWAAPLAFFGGAGLNESVAAAWLALSVCATAAMGRMISAGADGGRISSARTALTLLPLGLAAFLRFAPVGFEAPAAAPAEPAAVRHARLAAVAAHVAGDPEAAILAADYAGLELLHGYAGKGFAATMDFEAVRAARAHPGRRLYLMIRQPEGAAAPDAIHVRYPALYRRGAAGMLHAGDWEQWRLFEITLPAAARIF